MLLDEVSVGTKVTLTVTRGLMQMAFESEVIGNIEEGLLIKPFEYDEQMVNFSNLSAGTVLSAVLIGQNGRPYEWRDFEVKSIRYKNRIYSLLQTVAEGKEINRRKGYRQPLGMKGLIMLGAHTRTYNVIMKDISVVGVAFTSEEDLDISKVNTIHITFEDSLFNDKFNLRVLPVRKQELGNGLIVYGCKFFKEVPEIQKYIMKKQRATLKIRKGDRLTNV